MAVALVSRYTSLSFLFCLFFAALPFLEAAETPNSFSFESFGNNGSSSFSNVAFSLSGGAKISDSAVRITPAVDSSAGRIVYRKPVRFEGRNPGFSTYFSFSIPQGNSSVLAFSMTPSRGTSWLGSRVVVAVEFSLLTDTGYNGSRGSHVGIFVGREMSVVTSDLSNASTVLCSGEKLHSWVDYDGESKRLEVRLSKSGAFRPSDPLIAYSIDLSNVLWRETMLAGISSSSRNSTSYIYSWTFATTQGVPYRMHSDPLDPKAFPVLPVESHHIHLKRNYSWRILMALVFGAACGAMVAFFLMFIWTTVVFRRPVAPVEYPAHPVEFEYEKVILVEGKGVEDAKK